MSENKKEVMKMPLEQENQLVGLLSAVNNMTDEEFKKILNLGAGFHNYSLFNKMLIAFNGGSQVAGYEKWQKLKRQVKKGSKAIKILAPRMSYSIKVGGTWQYTTWKKHKEFSGEKRSFPTAFLAVNVFDIKDTEGEALPEVMTPKSEIKFNQVLMAAEKLGYKVTMQAMEYECGGYITGDKEIFINSNRSETANVGTLIHELCHGECGHTDTAVDHAYELKEQQAETATYLVCQSLGIDRNSVFYLKSWKLSENIMKDFQMISSVSSKITRAINGNARDFITSEE
jgi:hypothetical protein